MKTDILIIGAGVMGLATAYSISKATDREVLVLDRYGLENDYCSSNDINRVFRYSYGNDELYTRMAVESHRLWRHLEEASGRELLIETGLLLLQGEDENANRFNESSYRTLTRMKLGADRLAKDELTRRFPQFKAEEAFFDRQGGVLLASRVLQTLRSLAEARGVKFLRARALRTISGPHLKVETDSYQTIEFRRLVVTIGSWTNSLLTKGLVTVTPTRQQLIYLRPRAGLDHFSPGRCPVFFTERHYGLPSAGIDAVKVSAKQLDEAADPESASKTVDSDQIMDCREACRKFVPEIADGEVIQTKVCLYDMTENSDFVIDTDPDQPNNVFGYGFSGHGFKFAPLIGQWLSDLALDKTPNFNLDRFSAIPSKRRRPSLGAHLGKGE